MFYTLLVANKGFIGAYFFCQLKSFKTLYSQMHTDKQIHFNLVYINAYYLKQRDKWDVISEANGRVLDRGAVVIELLKEAAANERANDEDIGSKKRIMQEEFTKHSYNKEHDEDSLVMLGSGNTFHCSILSQKELREATSSLCIQTDSVFIPSYFCKCFAATTREKLVCMKTVATR